MRMMIQGIFGLLLVLSGCVTKPTLDLTNAPFQATSDATGGVSQVTSDLTQPTQEFTSSTTPGSQSNTDRLMKDQRVWRFVDFNFDNLRQNIAQGQGEYLGAFTSLLSIDPASQDDFYSKAQDRYQHIYAPGLAPRESFERLIREMTTE